jgi:acyl-CoA hydrolase
MLGGQPERCHTRRPMAMTPKPVSASKTVFSKTMLPSDANPSGNVHGGEIMRLIDECAGAAATRHARQRVVTARVDELSFVAPVYVGNLVTARASVNDVGTKSMEIGVRVDAEDLLTGKVVHVSSAYLVFVAIDDDGKTARLPPLLAESEDDKRRMAAAKLRRARRMQHR